MKGGGVPALCALAACCAHAQPVVRPYPAPTADVLLAALSAQQAAVRGMNARVRATSWLGGERVRATVNMLVERDGHLRLEAEISLQGTVATLATDGTTFTLYDAHKNEVSRGPACPANVASLVRIPLAPADVAAVLLGDARPPPPYDSDGDPGRVPKPPREGSRRAEPGGDPRDPATATVVWDARRGADVLALPVRDDGGTLQFLFRGDGAARTLVAVDRVGGAGTPLWRTAYEDHETVAGARVPGTIRFAEQAASFDDGVEIKLKDRTLNETLPADRFVLTAPPGVTVKAVGCGS